MGCDIHDFAEVRRKGKWEIVGDVFPLDEWTAKWNKKTYSNHPFDIRNYGWFGFLADVRNYSHSPVIKTPAFEIPPDVSSEVAKEYEDWGMDAHTATSLTLAELMAFDYEQVMWNRRVTKQTSPNSWNGAALADEGEGIHLPVRAFLGKEFFAVLDVLKTLGEPSDVRVVFWFDN